MDDCHESSSQRPLRHSREWTPLRNALGCHFSEPPLCVIPGVRPLCVIPGVRPLCVIPGVRPICVIPGVRPLCVIPGVRPLCVIPGVRPICVIAMKIGSQDSLRHSRESGSPGRPNPSFRPAPERRVGGTAYFIPIRGLRKAMAIPNGAQRSEESIQAGEYRARGLVAWCAHCRVPKIPRLRLGMTCCAGSYATASGRGSPCPVPLDSGSGAGMTVGKAPG